MMMMNKSQASASSRLLLIVKVCSLIFSVTTTTTTVTCLVHPVIVHTAVGAIAGSTGAIAAYPIDYVKSQLQTEEGRLIYKGGFDAAWDIVTSSPSGPFALYRGLMVNVVGIAPEKTIKLSANTFMRGFLLGQTGTLPLWGEVLAGGFAGGTQVIVTNPLEVVKVKLQTSQMTVQDVLSQMNGLADLYQGAGACLARDIVFSAVLFPLYAHLKVALAVALVGIAPEESVQFWAGLLGGSLAAAPAAIISTPADVVKTRLQQARTTDNAAKDNNKLKKRTTVSALKDATTTKAGKSNKVSTNNGATKLRRVTSSSQLAMANNAADAVNINAKAFFLNVVSDIVENEGPAVLMSGWFERVVRSVPQFGVTLAVFDLCNTYAIDHGWLLEQVAH